MKPFYQSKTLWANVAAIGLIVASHYGVNVPSPDPALIAVVNVALRLITDSALTSK